MCALIRNILPCKSGVLVLNFTLTSTPPLSSPKTHRLKKNSNAMSMETAYTKPLVCKMWALLGKFAGAHGYGVINNYDCSAYTQKDAIKNVVIGSLVR